MLHVPGANPTRTRRQRLRRRRPECGHDELNSASYQSPYPHFVVPPLPSPTPFPPFCAFPIEFLTLKLPHLIFRSVQQLATLCHTLNPSIFWFFVFLFRFVAHHKQQLKICCILFSIFPFFICISLLFQFISKFSVTKTNESFPQPAKCFTFIC